MTILDELQVKGEVEFGGRKLLEEGKYTPHPPDRLTFEEYFKGFGWSKGAMTFRGQGKTTVVTIEADFQPAAKRFRRLKGITRALWTRNYYRRVILAPLKAALEGRGQGAEAPAPAPTAGPEAPAGGRTLIFDREAEARAREEIRQREGRPASAGVSPSGEEKRKK